MANNREEKPLSYFAFPYEGKEKSKKYEPNAPRMASVYDEWKTSRALAQQQQVDPGSSRVMSFLNKSYGARPVDSSEMSTFKRGLTDEGVVVDALTHLAALSPGTALALSNDPLFTPLMHKITEEAMASTAHPDVLEKMKKAGYKVRLEHIRNKKRELIQEYYKGVLPDYGKEWLGSGFKTLADPTTLLPVGSTIKAGAAIGAGLLGTESALDQSIEKGTIDLGGVLLSATVGGVLGGALAGGGKLFRDWVSAKAESGERITKDELESFIKDNGINVQDYDSTTLTNEINKKFGLGAKTEMSRAISEANKVLSGNVEEALPVQEIIGRLGRDAPKDIQNLYKTKPPGKLRGKLKPWTRKEAGLVRHGAIEESQFFKNKVEWQESTSKGIRKASDNAHKTFNELRESIPRGPDGNPTEEIIEAVGGIDDVMDAKDATDAVVKKISRGEGPWAKMYTSVGRMIDWSKEITVENAHKLAAAITSEALYLRPATILRKLGPVGKELEERFRRGYEMYSMWTGDSMKTIEKSIRANVPENISTKSFKEAVANAMRDASVYRKSTPAVRKTVTDIRREFNTAVNRASKRGIIPESTAKKWMSEAEKEGFFPRLYDTEYLASEKGIKEWEKVLSEHNWTENQLEKAWKSLMDEKFRPVKGITKQKDGTYRVSKQWARRLWENRNTPIATRKDLPHHFKERKIDLPDEVLDPFLIKDPLYVAERYLSDVNKITSFAETVGKNGEVVSEIARRVNVATGGKDVGDYILSVYHHIMSDASDEMVKSSIRFMSRPSRMRSIYRVMNSFENFKLLLAPWLNLTQATFNTLMVATNKTGSFNKGLKFTIKGWKNALSKGRKGIEEAERSGAAIEQTIMQINGEAGVAYQKLSTTYLKWIGFHHVEKLQRVLGYNMGKALLDDVMSTKAGLIAKRAAQGLSKKEKRLLSRQDDILDSLGIDNTIDDLTKINPRELERAAQRWSNTVNFVRDADQLPLWAQSPYASIFIKFKTFAYWQGGLVFDNVLRPLAKGEVKPAMAMAAGSLLGYGPLKVREYIKSMAAGEDPEDSTFLQDWAMSWSAVGGMGLLYDVLHTSVRYNAGLATGQIVGPGIADAIAFGSSFGKGAIKAAQTGDLDALGQGLARASGGVAPPVLSQYIGRYTKEPKKSKPIGRAIPSALSSGL